MPLCWTRKFCRSLPRLFSQLMKPCDEAKMVTRLSWCVSRPARMTSMVCMLQRESSPLEALHKRWEGEQLTITSPSVSIHALKPYRVDTTSFYISIVFHLSSFYFSWICLGAGGMTSHAAVVARGMGRPCVAGAGGITVDYAAAKLTVGSVTVTEGQILTIDGSTGEVMVGEVPTVLWRSKRIDCIEQTWCTRAAGTTIRYNQMITR